MASQTMVTLFNKLYEETDWKLLVYITQKAESLLSSEKF